MTYQETLSFMYSTLPMFSHLGAAAYRRDLHNTVELCTALGNPQQHFKAIHIAGTNGKGSTSHMLAAVFQSAGYRTGLYTSPHLKDFRERIRVNGSMIPEKKVADFIQNIRPQIEQLSPSFFEITVAMAFDFFAKEKVDIAIIETGLGGRLDSTNIITPEASVITNIGWDHMNLLGNTLEEIAGEKAGIIKTGIPVIIGEATPALRQLFIDRAAEKKADICFAAETHYVANWENKNDGLHIEVGGRETDHRNYILDLHGLYQTKNILTVLETLHVMKSKSWLLPEDAVHTGLRHAARLTGLHGRWEKISDHPAIVLDVAHNEDGIRELVKQLEVTDYAKLHVVLGMVKDKEVSKALGILPTTATYYFTRAAIPRAMPEGQLAVLAADNGLTGYTYPSVMTALAAAKAAAGKKDLILVCGSVFVVGEVER